MFAVFIIRVTEELMVQCGHMGVCIKVLKCIVFPVGFAFMCRTGLPGWSYENFFHLLLPVCSFV